MRVLILIAFCVAVANASLWNKNRFQNLVNRYQQNQWGQHQFGLEDQLDDYVNQLRRERMFGRDQCPRDFEDILGLEDEEYDNSDLESIFGGRQYQGLEEMPRRRRFGGMEDLIGSRYSNQDVQGWGFGQEDQENEFGQEDQQEWGQGLEQGLGYSENLQGFQGCVGRQCLLDEESKVRSPLLKEVRDANVKLASRLYEQCKQEKDDKNIVASPLAIQMALASLNWGARGNTRRQIGHVIGGNLKTQERKQIFRALVRQLKGLRGIDTTGQRTSKINTVTGLFVSQRTPAQKTFIQQVRGVLGSTVRHCSFSQQPQQCRQVINQWISQKTQGKINHIVPQDAITDNTKMVLVNALELRAAWGPQMRHRVTKQGKFYPLDTNKPKTVQMIETEGRFKFHEDELVKVVGIPTKQQELTLYTIVPKDKDGLTDVEKWHLQDNIQLTDLLNKADRYERRVHIQLPKFQIKHKIDVRRTLLKQGVTDAFDSKRADFSGISGMGSFEEEGMDEIYGQSSRRRNPLWNLESGRGIWGQGRFGENPFLEESNWGSHETKLHLNKFIHQCTIKITENGITATTGSQTVETFQPYGRMHQGRTGDWDQEFETDEISGLGLGGTTGSNVVEANHAFAFVIKHNPTQQLIMVGRVIDAAQKKVNNVPQTINNVDQL